MLVRTTSVLLRVRALVLAAAILPGPASAAQVFHVEEMNTAQVAALDRQNTAVPRDVLESCTRQMGGLSLLW